MKKLAFVSCLALGVAACGQNGGAQKSAQTIAPADSFEYRDEVSGADFWVHPAVSFGSLVVLAHPTGLHAYDIEELKEISRSQTFAAQDVAISYIGKGADAQALVASIDRNKNAVRVFSINNVNRVIDPVAGDVALDAPANAVCFGRHKDQDGPTLYVLQEHGITRLDFSLENTLIRAKATPRVQIFDDAIGCAVDPHSEYVLVARESGKIHQFVDGAPTRKPLIDTKFSPLGDISVVGFGPQNETTGDDASEAEDGEDLATTAVDGVLGALNPADGSVHYFDLASGKALGSNVLGETYDIKATDAAAHFALTGANLGSVYRNGTLVLTGQFESDDGANREARLAPLSASMSSLNLSAGASVNPRGEKPAPAPADDNPLGIDLNIGASFEADAPELALPEPAQTPNTIGDDLNLDAPQ